MAAMTALLVLTAASTAIGAVGQVKAGNAAKRAGRAQQAAANSAADLSDYNAAQAALQAQDAIERGQSDEQRFRQQIAQTVGAQRAGFAAMGVDVGFGSALDTQDDVRTLGELDVLTIRNNASREALGYKVEAENYRKNAEILRKEGVAAFESGKQAQAASRYAAAGTIVGDATSMVQIKYGFDGRGYRKAG